MRVLALDIGEKRVGVAVSDPSGRVATPVCVLEASDLGAKGGLAALVDDYEVGSLLVGLPLSMDGSEGSQASRVRTIAEQLGERFDLPVDFADERLSTAQVARTMRDAGLSEREQRGKRDAVAAALFLQSWLDSVHAAGPRAREVGGTGSGSGLGGDRG